jgi:DNA-binding response OmpR family regulator
MPESKVFIVEDDANLLETLRYNLRKEGYNALTAADGEQALEIARKEKPDLIILDVMLPKINGFEVCRILERDDRPHPDADWLTDETDKIVYLEIRRTTTFSLQHRSCARVRRCAG